MLTYRSCVTIRVRWLRFLKTVRLIVLSSNFHIFVASTSKLAVKRSDIFWNSAPWITNIAVDGLSAFQPNGRVGACINLAKVWQCFAADKTRYAANWAAMKMPTVCRAIFLRSSILSVTGKGIVLLVYYNNLLSVIVISYHSSCCRVLVSNSSWIM